MGRADVNTAIDRQRNLIRSQNVCFAGMITQEGGGMPGKPSARRQWFEDWTEYKTNGDWNRINRIGRTGATLCRELEELIDGLYNTLESAWTGREVAGMMKAILAWTPDDEPGTIGSQKESSAN